MSEERVYTREEISAAAGTSRSCQPYEQWKLGQMLAQLLRENAELKEVVEWSKTHDCLAIKRDNCQLKAERDGLAYENAVLRDKLRPRSLKDEPPKELQEIIVRSFGRTRVVRYDKADRRNHDPSGVWHPLPSEDV